MVYIGADGRVYNSRPWTLQRFFGIFTGFFALILAFLRTLFEPLLDAENGFNNRRWGGGGGGGGGTGGGGGRPDGRGPPRPPRRIGRITTISDCSMPGGG